MTYSLNDGCTHGKLWSERCTECESISLRETISSFEPMVIKAKKRLALVERELQSEKAERRTK